MSRVKPPKAALVAGADDVEAQFYEALQQGDLARLMAVWGDDDEVVCVHPGGMRVVGGAAIRASFEALFAKGGVPAVPEQVHRLQALGLAVHHLVERVQLPTAPGGGHAYVLVTNVYVQTAQGWRMVAHHASPGRPEPPPAVQEWPSTLH
ncbi:MAG: nuclear transport factor 2 family protein [Rubrivivax sp.]|jgi:uncharacterized protein (TIGR02246 family)|nr:nuclear transport factor 2 family protein [Rubrivivax sp.]